MFRPAQAPTIQLAPWCTGCTKCTLGYNGVGVLLYDSKKKRIALVKCAWKDKKTGLYEYSDTGGQTEAKLTLPQGARKELYEETITTVDVDTDTLEKKCPWVNIYAGTRDGVAHCYGCYILDVQLTKAGVVSCTAFKKALPHASKLPKCYQETTNMAWFPLDYVKKEQASNFWTSESGSTLVKRPVSGRVRKVVSKAIAAGLI